MRKTTLLITFMLLSFMGFSQLRIERQPRSFATGQQVKSLQIISLPKPDMQQIEQEDIAREDQFKIRRFGVNLPVGIDLFTRAKQITTDDGTIWLLRFEAQDAQALLLYSNNFHLPEGGELYLYNSDKSQVIGAFTALNNHELNTFATELIMGDNMVIEYYQPAWQQEQATIEISEICYAYRDMEEMSKDVSGSCNVNVNCSEGDNYRNQQKGVCRILLKFPGGTGLCSGTLMNNTSLDKSPYILTAAHCIDGLSATSSYFSQFVFYFNYEAASCSGTSSSTPPTLTGATLKAWDNTYGNSGSDFSLLLLNNTIPTNYNTYWCGWTRSTTASPNGVGIHHPSGDIKKISTYTTALQSDTYVSSAQTHWKATWKQTANGFGITEGGSSGSALFNAAGLVVGTLSGGYSACNVSASNKIDWYGKISYSWASNGAANNRQLKPWLDPTNSDVTALNGSNFTNGISDIDNEDNNSLLLYPNPAEKYVTISLLENNGNKAIINIINSQGKTIYSTNLEPKETYKTVSVDNLPAGLYLVQLIEGNRISSKKLIIR
ncbi:MAG: T9SS type A sorting domain-containing protein [Bacteroidales bacterium]|jgi:hypothetical protein|nr:T9SS type A sorting domain-containing protein [Bacteroidales bacterium]